MNNPIEKKNRLHPIPLLLLALLLLSTLWGCGSKQADTPIVSMYDLCKAMSAATEKLADMRYVSNSDASPEELLENVSNLDYEKVAAFFIDYASNGGDSADEIVVIAVKDSADADAAKDSLEAHRSQRLSQYRVYCPEECEKLESGLVFSEGKYAVLIVAEDASAIKAAFSQFIATP